MDDAAIVNISATRRRLLACGCLRAPRGLLALGLALAACSAPPPPAPPADTVAGVSRDALISVTGDPRLYLVVYRSDLANPAQMADMPARLCAEAGETVKSSKERPPYKPAEYPAGTRLLFVECA